LPYAGYRVVCAGTGQEGLQLVSEAKPDIILTDLELPDMSGLKILEDLNDLGITIPTIMMTGYGSEGIAARALRLGVKDYLIKPFTTEEVLSSVERALSESRLRRDNERKGKSLDEYQRRFKVIQAIGQAAVRGGDLAEFLQRVVEAGQYAAGAEACILLLLDPDSGQLGMAAAYGLVHGREGQFPSLAGDEGLQPVLQEGQTVQLYAVESPSIELQNGDVVRSVLQIPLWVRNEICGLLSVDRRYNNTAFEIQDEWTLSILANYACLALELDRQMGQPSSIEGSK
jgi:two-component system NtrC family sensor kinase